MALNSESLTYWYFRLNGFFTIPNFVVHPDRGERQLTDVDVLGIRLPYRQELLENPMQDDNAFTCIGKKAFIAIAEVKSGQVSLNRTWYDSTLQNVQRFLRAIGPFPPGAVEMAAQEIYRSGCYAGDDDYHVSLVGIGSRRNGKLQKDLPGMLQITSYDIARFVFARFEKYSEQKKRHEQWDDAGHELWRIWTHHCQCESSFCAALVALGGNALTRASSPSTLLCDGSPPSPRWVEGKERLR